MIKIIFKIHYIKFWFYLCPQHGCSLRGEGEEGGDVGRVGTGVVAESRLGRKVDGDIRCGVGGSHFLALIGRGRSGCGESS